jgi:chromosomal replication initiation ATPase DnaA
MNYEGVYNYIKEDMGTLLDPLQRSVMLYEVEQFRKQMLNELTGSISGWVHGVCSTFSTTFHDINVYSRKTELVVVRQVIMWGLLDKVVPNTLSQEAIGALFPNASRHGEGLDHATVRHAKITIKNMLDIDADFRAKLEPLLSAFGWQCEYLPESKCFHMYRMHPADIQTDKDAA